MKPRCHSERERMLDKKSGLNQKRRIPNSQANSQIRSPRVVAPNVSHDGISMTYSEMY